MSEYCSAHVVSPYICINTEWGPRKLPHTLSRFFQSISWASEYRPEVVGEPYGVQELCICMHTWLVECMGGFFFSTTFWINFMLRVPMDMWLR
ncbi:hypothetical protein K440DRAFT_87840 [Wilcoxina mikolae CBS 423.85]|nr:hypothetical protein K440DRAFT_87840 [Wilcoxina mikolae CBS 423.85]